MHIATFILVTYLLCFGCKASSVTIKNLATGESVLAEVLVGTRSVITLQYSVGNSIEISWGRPPVIDTDSKVGFVSSDSPQINSISSTYQQYQLLSMNDTSTLKINNINVYNVSFSYPSGYPPWFWTRGFSATVSINDFEPKVFTIESAENKLENQRLGSPIFGMGGNVIGYDVMQRSSTGSENLNFVLIPEPSALSLLAVGLGRMAILRRRRS